MKLVSFEGAILLWEKVFHPSEKSNLYTKAEMIIDHVEKALKKGTAELILEKFLSAFTRSPRKVDRIVTSFKGVAPYDGRFLIPAIISKLNENSQHKETSMTFKISVLIATILYLHDNYEELKNTIHPCELLFIYMGNPWYNAIYDNNPEITRKDKSLSEHLRVISYNFLSCVCRGMEKSEYIVCIEFIYFMSKDRELLPFIKSKSAILDVIFTEFLIRIVDDPLLFKYVKVFSQSGYFEHYIEK